MIDEDAVEEAQEIESNRVPPEHPASVERCDHMHCENDSPGLQRICDACDPIMLAAYDDTCSYCGTSIRE